MFFNNKLGITLLSYPIDEMTPHYGASERGIEIKQNKNIDHNDSCNTYSISLKNHIGTHIDCPNHFYKNGAKIKDYSISNLVFYRPQILKINLEEGELLNIQKIDGRIDPYTDLLIIYSGWGMYRSQEKYALKNPGIHRDVASYIRGKHPSVRAVGIDFISVSSYVHREEGREAHKEFLNPVKEILIIEDMMINESTYNRVENENMIIMVLPLNIDEIDSAPCSIVGITLNRASQYK